MRFKILFCAVFAILIFSLLPFLCLYAQSNVTFGLNISTEIYPEISRPLVGAFMEKKFKPHSGIETGVYYHTARSSDFITITEPSGTKSYSFTISRRYLNIPVLYKYYYKTINLSAGPTLDLYVGWKQREDEFPYQIKSYEVNPKAKIGYLLKAGRPIQVKGNWIIEPEVRLGSFDTFGNSGLGVGISVKHKK